MNVFKITKTCWFVFLTLVILNVDCRDPETEKKIDANLKADLINLKKTSKLDDEITILFKTTEDLTALHHTMIEKHDVKVNANIGNIYTATIPARNVYNFSKMRFIEHVQGPKKLNANPVKPNLKEK